MIDDKLFTYLISPMLLAAAEKRNWDNSNCVSLSPISNFVQRCTSISTLYKQSNKSTYISDPTLYTYIKCCIRTTTVVERDIPAAL